MQSTQAGRTAKEGEVQVKQFSLCQKREMFWRIFILNQMLESISYRYKLIQVPTFPEFIDYVVKETVGLKSPKDWKVPNMLWIFHETRDDICENYIS